MVFSSLLFVFLFLVASYAVYHFCGKTIKSKNLILLISSLIFYAWGGPALVLLLCLMAFVCWAGAIIVDRCDVKRRRLALTWATVGICLAILFIFKYTVFTLSNIYALFSIDSAIPQIALPIGISSTPSSSSPTSSTYIAVRSGRKENIGISCSTRRSSISASQVLSCDTPTLSAILKAEPRHARKQAEELRDSRQVLLKRPSLQTDAVR